MKTNSFVYVVLLLLGISTDIFGQQENSNWYFGHRAGLSFNGGPTALSDGETTNVDNHTASISDQNGELLFYTDGTSVWNSNHEVISNGLNGGGRTVAIVPKPGGCDEYYIFTVNNDYFYSIVDFSTNPLGEITTTNQPLNILPYTDSSGTVKAINERPNHMAVAQHANGDSYWLILNPFDHLFTVLIDGGIGAPNVIQEFETLNRYGIGITGTSGMSVSPNMQSVVYSTRRLMEFPGGQTQKSSMFYLLNFDNSTGNFLGFQANIVTSELLGTLTLFEDFEFSSNSNNIFALINNRDRTYRIDQIDAVNSMNTNVIASPIGSFSGLQRGNYPTITRGINGNIYVPNGDRMLHSINDADASFPNANFTENAINLGARIYTNKLPHQVQIQQNTTSNCCPLISEAELSFSTSTGYVLSWEDIPNATYTLEFIVDYSCFSSPFPPLDGNTGTFTTTNNFISLSHDVTPVTGGRSWRYRIKTGDDCEWTEWCCVAYGRIDTSCDSTGDRVNHIANHENILVYPNPASNEISIATDKTNITSIEIYNIHGTLVKSVKEIKALQHTLDVTRLKIGYYILKITLLDGTTQYKNLILK